MGALVWQRTLPRISGYFWRREWVDGRPFITAIVYVSCRNETEDGHITDLWGFERDLSPDGARYKTATSKADFWEWAGPIPVPEEPA